VTGEAIAVAEGAVVEGVMRTTGRTDPVEFQEKRAENDTAAEGTAPEHAHRPASGYSDI
jgi:hypothetical protein